MKKLNLLFTALLLLCCIGTATAHNFVVNGIYYNILSSTNKTVEVTYKGISYNSYSDEYTGSVVIPESVTYNGTTYSVTSIGESAFDGCSGLTSITIPNSVTSIGNSALSYCDGLTSITIPNSVTSIGEHAFYGSSGLTNIVIGNSVTSIGNTAFAYCRGLTSISIPNSVTSIGKGAFFYCSGLTSITIPNSVTSMGERAFNGCSGLTSITIPNSVTSIGYAAFRFCSELTSITIPNSVTSIGIDAFQNCTGLTSITIPNSVTSIGGGAFSNTAWYDNQPDGVVYAGKVLYDYKGTMPSNTSITIKEGTLGIADGAFSGYSGLTSITIPNSVTSIGSEAFEGCSNVERLYIGSSIESIGDKAFAGCEKITEIKIALEKPIRVEANIFTNAVYDNATLYIPNGTKSFYEKREPWNTFFYIIEMNFTGIEDITEQRVEGENVYYDLSGRIVDNPTNGIYIVNGNKVLVK